MEFDAWHGWLILALLLALAEVFAGNFTLVAVGLACALGALLAATTAASLMLQIAAVGVAAAVLGPLLVRGLRPYLRRDAGAGPVGTGVEAGTAVIVERDGERLGIRYQGDWFPVRAVDDAPLEAGQRVVLERFEGITARVCIAERAPAPSR